MPVRHRLQKLLNNPAIWVAGQAQGPVRERAGKQGPGCQSGYRRSHHSVRGKACSLSTGFVELDEALNGGWPIGALTECLVPSYGIGELRVFMPALLALQIGVGVEDAVSRPGLEQRTLLVSPPYIPYAPALVGYGLDLDQLLVVDCRQPVDVLWAAEQALRSNACNAIFAWVGPADDRGLRRLQLAAEESQGWLVLFRPERFRRQRSPAPLRLQLKPSGSGCLRAQILKQRGGRPASVSLAIGSEA